MRPVAAEHLLSDRDPSAIDETTQIAKRGARRNDSIAVLFARDICGNVSGLPAELLLERAPSLRVQIGDDHLAAFGYD